MSRRLRLNQFRMTCLVLGFITAFLPYQLSVGGVGLAAQQISPAFEWRRSLGDAQISRSSVGKVKALWEHSASCFLLEGAEQFARPSVLSPLCRVSVVVDAQMNITRLHVGPAEHQDHLSAGINKACEGVILVRWWSAVSHSHIAMQTPSRSFTRSYLGRLTDAIDCCL